ncbi:PREDICTED: multiple inositol polyphosphate phosphatase 1-like [Ceratosolen solmsi marchali]|uniref:Multiple inositol polyphosphate phosphatase 1 n=1 Tax=Ceratosolen solmsi marchali TaxID=326594 RepID=A0AAJ7DZ52_9HYME|nr:PREDICTED: multiple inositol polyphosphate phosphatase 1-like [Ceratosolen solmsi marchali]
MWMMMRHGTRYASENEIPILLGLAKFRDQILKNHIANRERVKQAFPELIIKNPNDINSNSYVFRASNTARTNETLISFTEGLFLKKGFITPVATPESERIIEPYQNCFNWYNDYDSNHYNDESDKFIMTSEFQQLIKNVSSRLGFIRSLNFNEIYAIYTTCRYEVAWNPDQLSIWCMLFLFEEMKLMEYIEDLSYYYISGPGRKLSGQLGCHAVSDMFNHFEKVENDTLHDQPKGIFYFGHTLSIQILLAALKINADEVPINASNYHTVDRKYRTSLQTPFSANLMAVFYKCEGENKPNKVIFYLCEKPLYVHYCNGQICDWDELKKKFQSDIDTCTIDVCDKKDQDQ